ASVNARAARPGEQGSFRALHHAGGLARRQPDHWLGRACALVKNLKRRPCYNGGVLQQREPPMRRRGAGVMPLPAWARSLDWLRVIRALGQFVAPGVAVVALLIELAWPRPVGTGITVVVLVTCCLLTVAMIAICGWTVFLWDIDRLFFRLENRIDAQLGDGTANKTEERDRSLLGRARDLVGTALGNVRARSIALVERAYWDDINAGGVLSFPQPDIVAAIEHIDRPRRDLLAPLAEHIAGTIPLGGFSAHLLARAIFRYVAPEVKMRLYR